MGYQSADLTYLGLVISLKLRLEARHRNVPGQTMFDKRTE